MLRGADAPRVRWRNDGGWTREVHRQPADVSGTTDVADLFDWRLSIAEVEANGAFSAFDGYDRVLVLLDGAGMDLHFTETGETVELRPGNRCARFVGEVPIEAVPGGLVETAGVGHAWSVKDVLAHLAGAERGHQQVIHALVAGEVAGQPGFDLDAFNQADVAARERWTLAQVLEDLDAGRAGTLALLESVGDNGWDRAGFHPGGFDTTVEGTFRVIAIHERRHAKDIRTALAGAEGKVKVSGPLLALIHIPGPTKPHLNWYATLFLEKNNTKSHSFEYQSHIHTTT